MTELTDEAVKALAAARSGNLFVDQDEYVCIDDGRKFNLIFCHACDDVELEGDWPVLNPEVVAEIVARYNIAPVIARALLDARAERDRLRADAQAAVALVVERAAEHIVSEGKRLAEGIPNAGPGLEFLCELADEIRALADTDGGALVKPLEWEGGTYTTTDDDGGPREGSPRRLFAWRSHPYLIILQDGDRGMYILRGKSDGIGLVVPTLEAAKAAAQADYEARIIAALEVTP